MWVLSLQEYDYCKQSCFRSPENRLVNQRIFNTLKERFLWHCIQINIPKVGYPTSYANLFLCNMKEILKRSITNFSFWTLLAGNILCYIYFKEYNADFATIIWIYWFQSVFIGLVAAIELYLPGKNLEQYLDHTGVNPKGSNGCLSLFFVFHYGTFHLVYAVFLLVDYGLAAKQGLLLIALAAFAIETLLSFNQRRNANIDGNASTAAAMFLPYLRVFPMHLTIIFPKLMGLQASSLFILLKTVADIIGWLIYQAIYYKKGSSSL